MKRITGLPLVFDSDSVDLGGFIEQIDPASVDRTLRGSDDVILLRNHDSNYPLARRSARTLMLSKDRLGLAIDAAVDETVSFAGDVLRIIERGDAAGGSFAFRTLEDEWTLRNGIPFRRVLDMTVSELSVGVTFPAYARTRVFVPADAGQRQQPARPARSEDWYRTRLRLAR